MPGRSGSAEIGAAGEIDNSLVVWSAPDPRTRFPCFVGANLDRNLELVEALRAIAVQKGATVAQLAIAWVLARGQDIVPLVGARRRDRLAESLAALDLALTPEDLAAIEAAVPPEAVAGDRYAPTS